MTLLLAGVALPAAANNCTRNPDGTRNCNLDTITVTVSGFGGSAGGGGAFAGGGGSRDDVYNDSQSPMGPEDENPGQTEPGDQDGSADGDCKGGNPILLANGNKVEYETDFSYGFRSQNPLFLDRTYSHYWKGAGLFGKHWLSNFDYKLSFGTTDLDACHPRPGGGTCGIGTQTDIWAWRPDGRTVRYVKAADGVFYEQRAQPMSRIVQQANGEFWLYDQDGGIERYSSAGYIASVTDPYGIAWTYSYSGTYPLRVTHTSGRYVEFTWTNGQLTAVRDPSGNYYGYAYQANAFGSGLHRLSAVSRPGATPTTVTYHYEAAGLPGALTGKSFNGVRYSWFAYSPSGYAIETRHGTNIDRYSYAYAPSGNGGMTVTETNPLGKQGVYVFSNGALVSYTGYASTHCAATYKERVYDANGRMDLVSDFNGNITDYDYNAKGQVVRMVEAAGTPQARTTEYVWDSVLSRLLNRSIVGQYRIDYTYTADNRVASITETNLSSSGVPNQSRTTTYSYTKHPNGLLASVTVNGPLAGNTDTVVSTFNASGDLVSVTNGLGHVTTYSSHNGMGMPGRIVGVNGSITDMIYDAQSRVNIERRWIAGVAADTVYTYAANGLLASTTLPDGSITHYAHDSARRLSRIWRNANGTVSGGAEKEDRVFTFDPMSNIVRIENRRLTTQMQTECVRWRTIEGVPECVEERQVPVEVATVTESAGYEYDQQGRIRVRHGNYGQSERYGYDYNGNLKTITDSSGRVTTFAYDALDRVISSTDPTGATTTFEFNALDRITRVTDPRNLLTTYVYDGFGQMWAQSSPDTGSTQYQYDASGLRTLLTRNDGSQLGFQYDGLGRPTYVGNAQWARYYSYDWCQNGKNKLCGISVNDTQQVWNWTHFAYTAEGQLSVRRDSIANSDDWTAYAYDNAGRLSGISYPSGVSVGYGYSSGKLSLMNMTTAGGASHNVVHGIKYQPFASVSEWTYGNGLQRLMLSDLDGRPTAIHTSGVQGLYYEYDVNDEISRIVNGADGGLTQNFGYDALSRVVSTTTTANSETFAYDAAGNRTTRTNNGVATQYAYAATSQRLLSATAPGLSRGFTTNATGNVSSWNGADGALNNVTFDSYQRILTHDRNGITTRYRYNALDQRVQKTAAGGSVQWRYIYAGSNRLLAERYSNAANGTSQWTSHLWLEGIPVGLVKGETMQWVHADHLGRPEMVTNAAQQRVWRAANYAFNRSVVTDTIGGYNLGFPGQYWDEESGLWHNGFRDYEPTLGRYLQSDPIGLAGGLNTYTYVRGNPVSRIDPLGLDDFFTTLDIDLTAGIGIEISVGSVLDTDNLGDSGYYFSIGESAGGNVGVGLGVGYACRDIEGKGVNVDLNAGKVSPTVSFDDRGFNGGALTIGPGAGLSASKTRTWTLSVNSVLGALRGD